MIAASVVGLAVLADARGGDAGLSGKPADWCRDDADPALASVASLYRRNDGAGWTALRGDAGLSVSAVKLSDGGAALYMTRVGPTQLIATFDGLPSVSEALNAAAPVMQGQAKPLARIGTSRGGS